MKNASKILWYFGFLLILGSLTMLAISQLHVRRAQIAAAELTQQIMAIMPERVPGTKEPHAVQEMPVYQIDGRDFSALIDVPLLGVTLPIYSTWDAGKITSFPCRFSGSVYDGSLIVGGSDQDGQFSFLEQISPGCLITITDMTGVEFSYVVERIERSRSAQADVLMDDASDLTVFARDSYSLDYVIARCSAGRPLA